MIYQSVLLAVVLFFGSIATTEAQPYTNGGTAGQFTTLGWNFGHIANCQTFSDGVNTWHYAFIAEGAMASQITLVLPSW
jgi:hypothetical protein